MLHLSILIFAIRDRISWSTIKFLLISSREMWKGLREEEFAWFWSHVFYSFPYFECQLQDMKVFMDNEKTQYFPQSFNWYGCWCRRLLRLARRRNCVDELKWLRQRGIFPGIPALISSCLVEPELGTWMIAALANDQTPCMLDHPPPWFEFTTQLVNSPPSLIVLSSQKTGLLSRQMIHHHFTSNLFCALLRGGRMDLLEWAQPLKCFTSRHFDDDEDPHILTMISLPWDLSDLMKAAFDSSEPQMILWVWKNLSPFSQIKKPQRFLQELELPPLMGERQWRFFEVLFASSSSSSETSDCPFFRSSTFPASFRCRVFLHLLFRTPIVSLEEEALLDQRLCSFWQNLVFPHVSLFLTGHPFFERTCRHLKSLIAFAKTLKNQTSNSLFPFRGVMAQLQSLDGISEGKIDLSCDQIRDSFQAKLLLRVLLGHSGVSYVEKQKWNEDLSLASPNNCWQIPLLTSCLVELCRLEVSKNSPFSWLVDHRQKVIEALVRLLLSYRIGDLNLLLMNLALHEPLIMTSWLQWRFVYDGTTSQNQLPGHLSSFCPLCLSHPLNPPPSDMQRLLREMIKDFHLLDAKFHQECRLRRAQSLDMLPESCWVWCELKLQLKLAKSYSVFSAEKWILALLRCTLRFLDDHPLDRLPFSFLNLKGQMRDMDLALHKFLDSDLFLFSASSELRFLCTRILSSQLLSFLRTE